MRASIALVCLLGCGGGGNKSGDDVGIDAPAGNMPDAAVDAPAIDPCLFAPTPSVVSVLPLRVAGNALGIDIDTDGARTIVGSYNTAITAANLGFGTLAAPTAATDDGFIWRRGPDGSDRWLTVVTGTGADVVTDVVDDHAGAIYIVGRTTSPMVTLGSLTATGAGIATFAFVAKLAAVDGHPLWLQRIVGYPGPPGFPSLGCDNLALAGDSVVMTCNYNAVSIGWKSVGGLEVGGAPIGGASAVVVHLDPATGEGSWSTTVGNLASGAWTSAEAWPLANGHVLVGGLFSSGSMQIRSNTAVQLGASNASTGRDGYLAELDASGNPLWVRPIADLGTVAGDGFFYLRATARGQTLVVTGYSSSGIDLGSGHAVATTGTFAAALPLATAQTAAPLWLYATGDGADAAAIDACGRVAMTVSAYDQLSVGSLVIPAQSTGVLWVDAAGQPRSFAAFQPCPALSASCDPRHTGADLAITPTGSAVLVGNFGGSADFGTGTIGLGVGPEPFVVEYAP